MKNRIILLIGCLFAVIQITCAQDIIIFNTGDEVQVQVEEIEIDKVCYKKYDNLQGPVYEVLKSDVFMIKYSNGTKDVFNEIQSPVVIPSKKEPCLAFLFSVLLPGGGQYYNGQYLKGGIMTGIWMASMLGAIGSLNDHQDYYNDGYGQPYYNSNSNGVFAALIVIFMANSLWSMIDAPIAANKINKKNRLLSWNIGKNTNLALKPDFQLLSTIPSGKSFYSPSFGAKLSLTIK